MRAIFFLLSVAVVPQYSTLSTLQWEQAESLKTDLKPATRYSHGATSLQDTMLITHGYYFDHRNKVRPAKAHAPPAHL